MLRVSLELPPHNCIPPPTTQVAGNTVTISPRAPESCSTLSCEALNFVIINMWFLQLWFCEVTAVLTFDQQILLNSSWRFSLRGLSSWGLQPSSQQTKAHSSDGYVIESTCMMGTCFVAANPELSFPLSSSSSSSCSSSACCSLFLLLCWSGVSRGGKTLLPRM